MSERVYRIGVVADMVGMSGGLIRAWERRYGILEPRRTDSGYRAYTERDVELLRKVKQLTLEGISIADVVPLLSDLKKENHATPLAVADGDAVERWSTAILDAARRGQQNEVVAVLDEVFAALSPLVAFEQLIVPVQHEVGRLWHDGKLSVAHEHLVTHAVRSRLLAMIHGVPLSARRHVVCACMPEEDHEIGLLGVALRFRHTGFRVTYLGARTPMEQLAAFVASIRPDMVALSQVNSVEKRELKHALEILMKSLPSTTKVILGGAGTASHVDFVHQFGIETVNEQDWSRVLA